MGVFSNDSTLVRFIKFAGVGLIAGTVDISLVWVFTKFVFSGYFGEVIVSPVISYECSIIIGFIFSCVGVYQVCIQRIFLFCLERIISPVKSIFCCLLWVCFALFLPPKNSAKKHLCMTKTRCFHRVFYHN